MSSFGAKEAVDVAFSIEKLSKKQAVDSTDILYRKLEFHVRALQGTLNAFLETHAVPDNSVRME
jgi:hypothetical protein